MYGQPCPPCVYWYRLHNKNDRLHPLRPVIILGSTGVQVFTLLTPPSGKFVPGISFSSPVVISSSSSWACHTLIIVVSGAFSAACLVAVQGDKAAAQTAEEDAVFEVGFLILLCSGGWYRGPNIKTWYVQSVHTILQYISTVVLVSDSTYRRHAQHTSLDCQRDTGIRNIVQGWCAVPVSIYSAWYRGAQLQYGV